MGRRRAGDDPLNLAGTRLAWRRNKFWYRHRDGRWEKVGTDVTEAKRKAAIYNGDRKDYGTMAYWLDEFLLDCDARVASKDLAERTRNDYWKNVVELKVFFGQRTPEAVTPELVQLYLDEGKRAQRAVRANRERACLSACISWLIRKGKTTLKVNPCMRASGIQRNTERPRDRYVTDEEYLTVYDCAPAPVRLMMELVYRTLQRPESDMTGWTAANVRRRGEQRVLRVTQNKTGQVLEIELTGRLLELIEQAIGPNPVLHQPIVHTADGNAYTYSGITSMLTRAQAKARKRQGMENMPSFGFRDLKGKGATDMWLSGERIERIQMLCGHQQKATTETYVKARWRETVAPNAIEPGKKHVA
ncbi:integrase [Bordetella genomosp. 4]|uniref:Integrase n=2 Tax=Bordetella genomosp. 4 TaxID=463044 RepID=A0A261URS4_9BORD|nr:integrase [Bordetella genomosp. 4]